MRAGVKLVGMVSQVKEPYQKTDKRSGELVDQQDIFVVVGSRAYKTVGAPLDIEEYAAVEMDVTPFSFEGSKEVCFFRKEG